MSDDCLFCKIIAGEIPSEKLYEDESAYAFKDINPAAPHHFLVIPKKHIPTVNDIAEEDKELMGHLLRVAAKLAKENGVDQKGYRCVINVNRDALQQVFHIHIHVIAGRQLGWPPG